MDSLEALHEQEPPAPLDPRETQEREVFQGLLRTLAVLVKQVQQETQDLEERQDPWDHVETPETRGLQETKVALDSKGRRD